MFVHIQSKLQIFILGFDLPRIVHFPAKMD
jgi:hypothetical protein